MKLSIYTFVKNGLYYDYHVVEMLKHHLPLADEIVVVEASSSDGTFEAIDGLDAKVHIHRDLANRFDTMNSYATLKNEARRRCTGDWCILLDSDEFIPEWEFDRIRSTLETTDREILCLRFRHFYGNYKVVFEPGDKNVPPVLGNRIHRNDTNIEAWGDGANVRRQDAPYQDPMMEFAFECHHFGEVRHAARLREKWRAQALRHRTRATLKDWIPRWAFNLFPHRWNDPDNLPYLRLYDGPYIKAVRDNPAEFVRDGYKLCDILKQQSAATVAT